MILKSADKLQRSFKHANCRIQSLCDLLSLHNIFINPNLLYIHCFNILAALCYIPYKNLEYLFLVGFNEYFEETFFDENNIKYHVTDKINSINDIVTFIKEGVPIYTLCDANTISTLNIPKNDVQIGVCSGVVVVGVDFPTKVICNQILPQGKCELLPIDYSIFSRARTLRVYPSSPQNRCIYLELDENQTTAISKRINDVDIMMGKLSKCFRNILNDSNLLIISNVGVKGICNFGAFYALKSELKVLSEIDNIARVSSEIIDKVFTLKILLLRKSIVSGSSSFNRHELADALFALYEITRDSRLKKASVLFRESGNKLRQISRFLYSVGNYTRCKKEFIGKIIDMFDEVLNLERRASEILANLTYYNT